MSTSPSVGPLEEGVTLDQTLLVIDPAHLYWAEIDGLPRRANHETLRYAFEPHIPAPLEDIECRFVWTNKSQSWLACGAESSRLDEWIDCCESNDGRIESARPNGLPGVLHERLSKAGQDANDIASGFEFRSQQHESPRRARRRTLMTAAIILTVITASALVTTGHIRRTSAADAQTKSFQQEAITAADAGLQTAGVSRAPGVDPRLALAAEQRRLRQTRDRSADGQAAQDRSRALTTLLGSWPEDIPTVVDRIQFEQDSITIQGAVRDAGEFETMSLRLAGFSPEWTKRSSTTTKAKQGYTFTIQFSASSLTSRGDSP